MSYLVENVDDRIVDQDVELAGDTIADSKMGGKTAKERLSSWCTGLLLFAALCAVAASGTTFCSIWYAGVDSLVCFLCFLFLLLAAIALLFATCASALCRRGRAAAATPFMLISVALLALAIATAAQLSLHGEDAPRARFVGEVEELFGDNVDTGDASFSEFRIPSLVATQAALVAFAEGRRGTTSLHGDFAPTELVFRVRPMAEDGGAPAPWSSVRSLTDLLRNSGFCNDTSTECLPARCERHMSNAAPAVTSWQLGDVLMVFNCENTGTYAVRLKVTQAAAAPAITVAGPLQTVMKVPPQGATWVGAGPPASLFLPDEGAVLVPVYYAWTRRPELFDGLDSYGMTLRYDMNSSEWSVPCAQYGGSKGEVNEHQYFTHGGEAWAFARTINYNPWSPRRSLLRRETSSDSDTCFEVVSEPRFLEQLQGCEGSVISTEENGSERVFYTGVDGSVLYRRKLQLFEAIFDDEAGQSSVKEWRPLATIHSEGAAYSALALVDGGLLGVLYERADEPALAFHPTDIVLRRINTSSPLRAAPLPESVARGRVPVLALGWS